MRLWEKYRADFKQNTVLAVPIMAGQLGQVTVNLADNIMVGRLGAASLAAVSVANAVIIVFLVVGMGISFALPPLVSEADGAGKKKRISQYFKHSLIVNLVFAFLSMGAILLGIPLLRYLGQEPEVLTLAIPYLKITAISMIPMMIFQTLRCYCDGLSNTVLPMVAIIAGNVLNVILNYGFIFGKMGFPNLGMTGAATASIIARIFMVLIIVGLLLNNQQLKAYLLNVNFRRYQRLLFTKILNLGVPTSLQMFFEVTAFSGAALMMGLLGKNPQAAHQISINLSSITFLICTGMSMAATIRVGNQLGKKNKQAIRDAGFSAILQVVMIMVLAALFFIIFRHFLPTIYIKDQVVIEIASSLLILAAIFQIPDGVQVAALGALRGVQDVRIPTLITFISYWIFGLPASYILAIVIGVGPSGVWIGLIVGLTLSASLLTYRFHMKTKIRNS